MEKIYIQPAILERAKDKLEYLNEQPDLDMGQRIERWYLENVVNEWKTKGTPETVLTESMNELEQLVFDCLNDAYKELTGIEKEY